MVVKVAGPKGGFERRGKGFLRQILETAVEGFGGNLDVAIRSPQIRNLIEPYAMSTGQRLSGMPATVRARCGD